MQEGGAPALEDRLREAQERARSVAAQPFEAGPPYMTGAAESLNALALAEFLLDWYIEIGDRAKAEPEAERSRSFAAQLIVCMRAIRSFRRASPA
jgi:hypothetical protein